MVPIRPSLAPLRSTSRALLCLASGHLLLATQCQPSDSSVAGGTALAVDGSSPNEGPLTSPWPGSAPSSEEADGSKGADGSAESPCTAMTKRAQCRATVAHGALFDAVCSRLSREFGASCSPIDAGGMYGQCTELERLTWAYEEYHRRSNGHSCLGQLQAPSPSSPTPSDGTPLPPRRYQRKEAFLPGDFFDHFDFFSAPDPTHGHVQYLSRGEAMARNLVYSDPTTGRVIVAADTKTLGPRPSVRLESKTTFTEGLVIIDVVHMPEGPGVWPAFWSFGPQWPSGGEIDIVEGVNDQDVNMATLHTALGCTMHGVSQETLMSGTYLERDCNASGGYVGCGTRGAPSSFGPNFNAQGGGVFAMMWRKDAIAVWFWPRGKAPGDIAPDGSPMPSTWGRPMAHFALGAQCPASHFREHRLVLNTTFCGDWAGATFRTAQGAQGPAACQEAVGQNPGNYRKAYWDIGYILRFSEE